MSLLAKKCPALCTDNPLENTDIRNKLHLLLQLLRSCFGPTGRLKHVHNNIGGHVVTTSTSSVLLTAISSSQPLVNLIKTSILNHVSRFGDCGLFAAILCLSLVEQAKRSALREHVVIAVNKHLLALCAAYLQRDDCGCKVQLDFCSSQNFIKLARSVISSKPACMLTGEEALHISRLTVRAFLLTVPCERPGVITLGRVVTVSVEGHSVMDSAVFPGLLVDIPDVSGLSEVENLPSGELRVVLFSASLAGDLSELGDGIIEVHSGVDTDSQILDQLLELCKQVVLDGVKLFVCQKVIHPVLQQYLRTHGTVVVERVGIALMEPLVQLTGAQPVATLNAAIPAGAYGKLKNLNIRNFGAKKMLHLQPLGDSVIAAMILCHRNESMLSELKVLCEKTEHVLRLTLRDPSVLLGGGCTETHLAAYVRHKSVDDVAEKASVLHCSRVEYLLCVEGFCRSLEAVASSLGHGGGDSLMDLSHAHHWTLPADGSQEHLKDSLGFCGCGLMECSPTQNWTFLNTEYQPFSPAPPHGDAAERCGVLDSFTAKFNALHVAVETANLVLDVRYIIQDVN